MAREKCSGIYPPVSVRIDSSGKMLGTPYQLGKFLKKFCAGRDFLMFPRAARDLPRLLIFPKLPRLPPKKQLWISAHTYFLTPFTPAWHESSKWIFIESLKFCKIYRRIFTIRYGMNLHGDIFMESWNFHNQFSGGEGFTKSSGMISQSSGSFLIPFIPAWHRVFEILQNLSPDHY